MAKVRLIRVSFTLNQMGPNACSLLEDIFDNWLHQSWSNFVWDYIQKRLDKSVEVVEICFYDEIVITMEVPLERFDVHALVAKVSSIETAFISEFCIHGALSIHSAKNEYLGSNSVEYHKIHATNGEKLHARGMVESIFFRKLTRYLGRFAIYQSMINVQVTR